MLSLLSLQEFCQTRSRLILQEEPETWLVLVTVTFLLVPVCMQPREVGRLPYGDRLWPVRITDAAQGRFCRQFREQIEVERPPCSLKWGDVVASHSSCVHWVPQGIPYGARPGQTACHKAGISPVACSPRVLMSCGTEQHEYRRLKASQLLPAAAPSGQVQGTVPPRWSLRDAASHTSCSTYKTYCAPFLASQHT